MRILLCLLSACVVFAGALRAQVAVEVVMEQDQVLRDESLPLKVRITNRSGQTLEFGAEGDWLTFFVESRDGLLLSKEAEVKVSGAFSLESATAATRTVDLMEFYRLSQPGRYTVTATIKIKEWENEVSSAPKSFDILRGTKIWEEEFGVPGRAGLPEVRKYALQQVSFFKGMRLYVRVTDLSESQVFRVRSICAMVPFGQPEAQVDRSSNLHVLVQTGARSFSYHMINPDGEVLVRQTHDFATNRPALKGGKDGQIIVSGGQRRLTPSDLPRMPTATNDVAVPKS